MKIIDSCKTAIKLKEQINKLSYSLDCEYNPFPLEIEMEFANAALSTLTLIKGTLFDVVNSNEFDLNDSSGLYLAINLAYFDVANILYNKIIYEMRENNYDEIEDFKKNIRRAIDSRGLGEIWIGMVETN